MSPTKRSLDAFRQEKNYWDNDALTAAELASAAADDPVPLKRLRGGGGNDDVYAQPPADLHEDDLYGDRVEIEQEEQVQPVPEDYEDDGGSSRSSSFKRWQRKAVPADFDNGQDLNLQWLDMDVVAAAALDANPNRAKKRVVGQQSGTVPVLRAYGVTEQGHSAAVFIHGFTPYGYFALPAGFTLKDEHANLPKIRQALTGRLQSAARGNAAANASVVGVSFVEDTHKSIMGYDSPHTKFLKVYVSLPGLVPPLKRIMEEGINLPGIVPDGHDGEEMSSNFESQFPAFECNVPFVLRFMVDRDLGGAGWLTLPASTYQIRPQRKRSTHCQIEVDISHDDLIARKSEGEWNKIAPLRILSIDIECQGRKGFFPEADKDPCIQIANVLTVYSQEPSQPLVQNVFTLKGCLPIVGAQVISADTEQEMLMQWRDFLQASDPDIITGYNVQNFDIPYLLDRAAALGKQNKRAKSVLAGFAQWGRIRNAVAKMRDTTFQSAAHGKRNNVETTIDGRVIFDMLPYMQRNHKLSSYSLNAVCAEFLGQQKEDVHHSIISDLQNGSDEDRHRLAVYCLKDAVLPGRLMEKLSVLVNYVEMARVTGVPMSFLISRGQQIKVYSMILRKCRKESLLVPTLAKAGNPAGTGDVGYEGATVLDPIKDYYQVPIATLDFASLYPSIMQAYNLCYSTLVNPADVAANKVDADLYKKSDNGHCFVHAHVKKGILPTILSELLAARKRAKKDMKNAPTEFERAVQNGRQLALKVSANSVYGFTGATVGQLPCLAIASSVTSYGRYLLERTKEFVEQKYCKAAGYEHDATVIYGDTDSVMVKFGVATVKEAFPLAEQAAEECSKIFPNPILLEFEKVYYPYLLMNKKRYAGLQWTHVEKYDKMDTKGLETVRRDNCALVRDVIQTSLDKILIHQDVPGAISYVKSQISDLLQNKMDISRLVITKSLHKGAEYALGLGGKKEDYKVKQAHVELAARMKKRDAGSAPQMGDRVPYVIIAGAKGAANFEKAEDPIYVLEQNLPIDCKWYLTNQLSKPLTRIFEPIIGGEDNVNKTLLEGEHTRKIFIPTPTARKGSLMMFAVKQAQCIGCKASISQNTGYYLCKHCAPKEAEIYLSKLAVMREAELRYAELWAAAQRIHGTIHSDIICTGDGCQCQFYRRKKVQADIRLAQEVLDKFGR